jgi:hypothetical protein
MDFLHSYKHIEVIQNVEMPQSDKTLWRHVKSQALNTRCMTHCTFKQRQV